ncbi:hypothetical protein DSO57_1025566 [Entomophthora muscae]|uniref:Uncharacterized protein n=1 Tax=Entomophthora muscae TaxID=34485 RepID=A0ACC2RTJ6_9FUNG|nr:hypothetical protein DSO57_1025566 [Entomophthora muscae]
MHNFLMGGTGTTSDAIVWVIYLLMKHPNVEAKVYAEIKAAKATAKDKSLLSYAECQQCLPYLTAVIKETLRIAPVSSVELNRTIPEGGRMISGYFLPHNVSSLPTPSNKQTECTVPIYSPPHVALALGPPQRVPSLALADIN